MPPRIHAIGSFLLLLSLQSAELRAATPLTDTPDVPISTLASGETFVRVNPVNPNVVLVADKTSRVHVSTDGGEHWSALLPPVTMVDPTVDVIAHPSYESGRVLTVGTELTVAAAYKDLPQGQWATSSIVDELIDKPFVCVDNSPFSSRQFHSYAAWTQETTGIQIVRSEE